MKMSTLFKIIDINLDHKPNLYFIGTATPCVSWKIETRQKDFHQTAYQIIVRTPADCCLWDSGKIFSAESAEISWGGEPLNSRQIINICVTVWDNNDRKTISEVKQFETTLLHQQEWYAKWIYYSKTCSAHSAPSPLFRRDFTLKFKPLKARLYISARGLFVGYLNGKRIGNDHFVPGWVDFDQQIPFLTYDVTDLVNEGKNAIGAMLGEGWYCGYLTGRFRNNYGERPELLLQLECTDENGNITRITSGSGWKTTIGPILYSDIYDGEFYDCRRELPGWNDINYHATAPRWTKADIGESARLSPVLVPKINPPVRIVKALKPIKILAPRPDTRIWDFGQNITGNVKIKLKQHLRSTQYQIRFGEMLYDDGTLYTLNYRSAHSTDFMQTPLKIDYDHDCWIPNDIDYEPEFTFHGFRYVQIDGFQYAGHDLEKIEVEAHVLSCDLETTGQFNTGNPKLNRLYQNIRWGQIDNFLEIPTDCPQRDERLGWTGDAEIFIATACRNLNSLNFYRKYLRDLREAQYANGAGTDIAPDVFIKQGPCRPGNAAWADAIVICPWTLYMRYGSIETLRENYPAMKKWVDYQHRTSNKLIRPATSYGDWLAFDEIITPSEYVGSCYFAYTTSLVAQSAEKLGYISDAKKYNKLYDKIKSAIQKKYLDKSGIINIRNQTAIALALHFKLLPQENIAENAALLAKLVNENGNKLSTGFVGTSCLNLALSETGYHDTAEQVYLQEEFPSWLFSVNQGATTIWERWNSYTKKDGFGPVTMNSFNHYAFGAIHEWIIDYIAGIHYISAGGQKMRLQCHPCKAMNFCETSQITPYGKVTSNWKYIDSKTVEWTISIPANTTGEIVVPEKWYIATGSIDKFVNNQPLTLILKHN